MATKIGNLKGATGAKGSIGSIGSPGAQGPPGPTSVSTDANNAATLGSDSLPFVPSVSVPLADTTQNGLLRQVSGNTTDFVDGSNHCQALATAEAPIIQAVRQNSINVVGNANFEVDQRNVGNASSVTGGFICDRWYLSATVTKMGGQQIAANTFDPLTGYQVGTKALLLTNTTVVSSYSTGNYSDLRNTLEGPMLRPLMGGPWSVTIQLKSSGIAQNLGFAVRESTVSPYYSFTKLIHVSGGGVTDTIYLPNLPAFPSAGFPVANLAPGKVGAYFGISLGAEPGLISTANDVWVGQTVAGVPYRAALGQDFWTANAANTTLQINYIQIEPGPYCTPFIELPFAENLLSCQRYFAKSNAYGTLSPTANDYREIGFVMGGNVYGRMMVRWPVPMAAVPTVTLWDNVPNLNYVYTDYQGSVPLAASGGPPTMIDTVGFGTVVLNAANPASTSIGLLGQWRADTGW